ncbi:hypothetical protein ARTHRO9AX_220116 [Arthrobacter sp. 9AX]|nr:hypothetical protein ARTHRO9AX_220116 [Arthrobacter sp. 9AX]
MTSVWHDERLEAPSNRGRAAPRSGRPGVPSPDSCGSLWDLLGMSKYTAPAVLLAWGSRLDVLF